MDWEEEKVSFWNTLKANSNQSVAAVLPKSAPPPVGFVHPRLAKFAKPAPLAVSNNNHFFLKNPNFGLGFAGAAASAAIHSYSTAASHVI